MDEYGDLIKPERKSPKLSKLKKERDEHYREYREAHRKYVKLQSEIRSRSDIGKEITELYKRIRKLRKGLREHNAKLYAQSNELQKLKREFQEAWANYTRVANIYHKEYWKEDLRAEIKDEKKEARK